MPWVITDHDDDDDDDDEMGCLSSEEKARADGSQVIGAIVQSRLP